jgi:hypothetical protein
MGQYLSAYRMLRNILGNLENTGGTEFQYDPHAPLYILRMAFFYLKIILTIFASLVLLFTIFLKLR